jgi:hypothetical protein
MLPGRRAVPKATWQTRISGIEPGQSIYGHIRLSCTGFLTVEGSMLIGYARVSTDDQNLDCSVMRCAWPGARKSMRTG